ncbi:MAG: exo-beta-N-acetylmuramidase NamZ domain-containing protein [Acidimicrobiales bacterium]
MKLPPTLAVVAAMSVIMGACGDGLWSATTGTTPVARESSTTTTAPRAVAPAPQPDVVLTGAEVLADTGFAPLDGKRVGLIANHTSLVRGTHLIDVLDAAPNVELEAVFAPEHGVRGTEGAGTGIDDETDPATGVRVLSLYGETKKPTPEMLAGLDVVVYDLQDVGARFYTFISTMGLAMQAAAEAGVGFVVLDRPDPTGGGPSAGFVLEPELVSFIGQYPIPAAYGLTPGELALAIEGEGWIDGLEDLDLEVVEMSGWSRGMTWDATHLGWVPPSPGLPGPESAFAYPGTVLLEATSISYGGGTDDTFTVAGAPWADGSLLAADLDGRGLAGVRFEPLDFVPRPLPGRSDDPRLNGERLSGVRIVITDEVVMDPVAVGVHLLEAFHTAALEAGIDDLIDRPRTFDLLAGTPRLREMLVEGARADAIVAAWREEAAAFDALRSPYELYS